MLPIVTQLEIDKAIVAMGVCCYHECDSSTPWSIQAAAKTCGVSASTMGRWVRDGIIETLHSTRRRRKAQIIPWQAAWAARVYRDAPDARRRYIKRIPALRAAVVAAVTP